jgi:hypothetical protein
VTEGEAILGARGKDTVGLVNPLPDQVLNQDACIGLFSTQPKSITTLDKKCRVDSRHETLTGGFLISGRSIDLTRMEQPCDASRLQVWS